MTSLALQLPQQVEAGAVTTSLLGAWVWWRHAEAVRVVESFEGSLTRRLATAADRTDVAVVLDDVGQGRQGYATMVALGELGSSVAVRVASWLLLSRRPWWTHLGPASAQKVALGLTYMHAVKASGPSPSPAQWDELVAQAHGIELPLPITRALLGGLRVVPALVVLSRCAHDRTVVPERVQAWLADLFVEGAREMLRLTALTGAKVAEDLLPPGDRLDLERLEREHRQSLAELDALPLSDVLPD